ncbi:MAG: nucleoside kinase, partial [Clostridia bacterium]|nr:nucleoside kinase [Clostridia bacterium]
MNRIWDGKNEEHRRIYERSARLILLLAMREEMPGAKVRFEHSIGQGLYMTVHGADLSAYKVRAIEKRMHEIAERDIPIVKSRWTREAAQKYFEEQGQMDTVRLLGYRPFAHFDVYTCDGMSEYFYGDSSM